MTPYPTTTYAEFTVDTPLRRRARNVVRDLAIRMLACGKNVGGRRWIRFIYYHHVFDDERKGFVRQLQFLSGLGDFLSIEDSVALLRGDAPLDGCYFCVGFDDGLKSCVSGALPILAEARVPAVFYVIPGLVGQSLAADDPLARKTFGFQGRNTTLDFMTWDDCRALISAGMTIGSHSLSHVALATLDPERALAEMAESKAEIERTLGTRCDHFCAPYGTPGVHFDPTRDPGLARAAEYASFATGERGPMVHGGDPFYLKRDHLLAGWGEYQLRYFLSKS